MTTKLERIAKMEAELAALKKDVEAEGQWVSPVFYPKEGDEFEYLNASMAAKEEPNHFRVTTPQGGSGEGCIQPQFRPGTGQAFADAFQVMLELRACEGQCQVNGKEVSDRDVYYLLVRDGLLMVNYLYDNGCSFTVTHYSLSGAFSTREYAQAALGRVGAARIIAAAKTLANWKE